MPQKIGREFLLRDHVNKQLLERNGFTLIIALHVPGTLRLF